MTSATLSAFTVDPSVFGIDDEPIAVCVTTSDDTATFTARDQRLSFRTCVAGGRPIGEYIGDLGNWLDDLITSKAVVRDDADVLLLRHSPNGRRWLTFLTRDGEQWCGDAVELSATPGINVSYTLSDGEEQTSDITANHRRFMKLAGTTLFSRGEHRGPVLLRVKVSGEELWFLRFPFGAYAKLKLDGFKNYTACQSIVTKRSVSEVASRQAKAESEWRDTRTFFESTYIVLNTYVAHSQAMEAANTDDAFALLIDVLEQLQDLQLMMGGGMGLRWTLNPSSEQLQSILLSESTHFVVADFEAAGGVWTLGDRGHRCAKPCEHAAANGAETFHLEALRGRLRHIRLMRIYHCNSLFDAYHTNTNPADDSTIAAALLATDSGFIEGSLTAEPIIDFVCATLDLLLRRSDVSAILRAKSLIGAVDLPSMMSRADALLQQRGFSTVSTATT